MNTFMGLPIPPTWVISQNVESGNLNLQRPGVAFVGMSGIEVRNHIAQYWNERETNEQHRPANQTTRDTAPTQHPAGNTGGAASHPSALPNAWANSYAQQASIARQNALQGLAQGMSGQLSAGAPQGLGYAPLPLGGVQQQIAQQKVIAAAALLNPKLPREKPAIGELIGHRAWIVSGGYLHSVTMGSVWYPGKTMCDRIPENGHTGVQDDNHAGIWAFKDPYDLAHEFWAMINYGGQVTNVRCGIFGTVYLWGTVIEHEHGYRAQYAAVRSLDKAAPGIDLEALRAIYLPPRA